MLSPTGERHSVPPLALFREQRNGGRVARIAPLSDNIFQILPRADTGAVQVLLRTLAGLEDFARVNAHQKRRELHPLLAGNEFKHNCLSCLVYRNVKVLDSKWHSFSIVNVLKLRLLVLGFLISVRLTYLVRLHAPSVICVNSSHQLRTTRARQERWPN